MFKPGDLVIVTRSHDAARVGQHLTYLGGDIYQFEDQSGNAGWLNSKTSTYCYHIPEGKLKLALMNDGLDNWE